jgi:hypothetical protein
MLTFVLTPLFWFLTKIREIKVRKRVLVCFAFSTCLSSCVHFHFPSSIPCTFNLTNVFSDCHNPTSGTHPISYTVVLQVMYYNGSQYEEFNEQKVSSASTPSSTISISSGTPKETLWYVDITLVGGQCSRCAPSTNNGRDCIQVPDGSTGWYAGVPQRTYTSSSQSTSPASFSISTWTPMANASCNCVVPN